jgi:hypothetical protein
MVPSRPGWGVTRPRHLLTSTCDRGAASETATDQPGTRRFDERIRTGSSYRDRRFYLLPGACMA